MATERKELDLIIRAAVKGGKSVDEVVASITKLEAQLKDLAEAAKRGDAALDELRATELALKDAQDQLVAQNKLINQFTALATAIGKTEDKLGKSTTKFDEYNQKIGQAGVATQKQVEQLNKLGASVERNQTILTKQRTDYEALTKTLKETGVDIGNIAGAQSNLQQVYLRTSTAVNAAKASIASYATDVRKAREAEKELAAQQDFTNRQRENLRSFREADLTKLFTPRLDALDAAEAQAKLAEALQKTADQAIATARGYKTLGTAAKTLESSTKSVSATIEAILNPQAAARRTQGGIEAEVNKLAASISQIKGPIADYRQQVQQLMEAQRALNQQANLVDAYNKQIAALRQARAEFVANRAQVLQYAETLKSGAAANAELEARLKSAQQATAASARNLQSQVAAARELRSAVREAGLSTANLSSTQERLTATARTSASAMTNLKNAYREYGDAAGRASTANVSFNEGGRTTLSLLQRIRGEVLSLIAAYAGIQGAIGGAGAAIAAFNERQQIQNRLAVAVGDSAERIGEEYAYIREQSERIGLDFGKSSEAYSKFAVAATKAGASVQETRFIFESFGEAGTVLGINGERMRLVFNALEQMMSKNRVTAEELRQQLGESLPGAFELFQQSVQDRFPDLDAALKEGKVTAGEILNFAQQYRDLVANRLPQATQSLIAQQNRYNNALLDFKLAVADAGFIDSFTDLLQRASTFFQSEDGRQFAQSISAGFAAVADVLAGLLTHLDEVIAALQLIAVVYGAKTFLGITTSAIEASKRVAELNKGLTGVNRVVGLLNKGLLLLQAATLGWTIGTWLRTQFVEVRLAGIALVTGLESLFTRLKYTVQIVWEEIPNVILDALATLGNAGTSVFRTLLEGFSAAARAIGKNELADTIDKATQALTFGVNRTGSRYHEIVKQMNADLAQIKKIGEDMVDAELAAQNPQQRTSTGSPTANPGQSSIAPPNDTSGAERRLNLMKQIEAELAEINTKIERQEKESLDSRLKAIDDTYFRLRRKIQELGGKEAEAFNQQLATSIAALKVQETRKFNEALLQEQETLTKKLEQIDAQAGRNQKTDLDSRLAAVKQSYEQTYREIDDFRAKLVTNGRDTTVADLAKDRLDAGVKALQLIEQQKYYEDALNAVLDERKAKLETIRVMEETGLITATQARERAAEVVTQTQPAIEALTSSGLEFVDTMIAAAEATGQSTAALEALRAKLIEARESAKGIKTELVSAAEINESLATGATQAFDTVAKSIGNAITGLESWRDVLLSVRDAFLQFAADFLMEIAKMILKQTLLNALQQSSPGGFIASAVNAAVRHDGGLVNNGGRRRVVPAAWFANAPRYHSGGVAGLAPDEYPAILKRNEEVLSANNPRNVMNGGGSAATNISMPDIKVINMVDSGSVVSEGLSTPDGSRAFLNFIRANKTGLKQILG